jgi:hypothetical protein
MAFAELIYEYLLGGIESARGTTLATPTHFLNLNGTLTPRQTRYKPAEKRGVLAEFYRSKTVRQWSEWEGNGGADVYTLPLFLECITKGGVTPTVPSTGVYLWTYTPTMNADDLKTLTMYWGDPNIQAWQADYALVDELKLTGDASTENGVEMSLKGLAHFPKKVAPLSVPTMLNAPLLAPGDLDIWIDTTSAIGTTAVTGRVISAEFTVPSGVVQKYLAVGAGGGTEYAALGRKPRHVELKLVMEIPDMTQYDAWAATTLLKVRCRWSGPIIASTYRYYIECDVYGPFDSLEWGELEGTNRTIALTIMSEYNVSAATDFAIKVQNDRATM